MEALKQGRSAEALSLLTEFCQHCNDPRSKDYAQAQIALVRAYQRIGQQEQALALCQQLLTNPLPPVQKWAREALPSLKLPASEPTGAGQPTVAPAAAASPPSEDATTLLRQGTAALKQGDYATAITTLEQVCQRPEIDSQQQTQAQMALIRAYKANSQPQEAIALCQQLVGNPEPMVQNWAQQFLATLMANQVIPGLVSQKRAARQEAANLEAGESGPRPPMPLRSLNELKDFYQKQLIKDLKPIEVERKTILRKLLIAAIVFFGIGLVTLPLTRGVLLGLGAVLWLILLIWLVESYGKAFKFIVIRKIVEFMSPDNTLAYSPDGVGQSFRGGFVNSQLFKQQPDRFVQSDLVTGKLGETEICFAQICAETQIEQDEDFRIRSNVELGNNPLMSWLVLMLISKGSRLGSYVILRLFQGRRLKLQQFMDEVVWEQTKTDLIFKGLFFWADFNKNFHGRTVIVPDTAERLLGHMGRSLQEMDKSRGQLVKLEDREFEKLFAVYGTDQVEARYILSTSLMERLVKFRKRADRELWVGFVDDKIYIAVKFDEDLFEPRLFKTMLAFEPIQEYFEILQLMLSIVEELNLNLRIWGK